MLWSFPSPSFSWECTPSSKLTKQLRFPVIWLLQPLFKYQIFFLFFLNTQIRIKYVFWCTCIFRKICSSFVLYQQSLSMWPNFLCMVYLLNQQSSSTWLVFLQIKIEVRFFVTTMISLIVKIRPSSSSSTTTVKVFSPAASSKLLSLIWSWNLIFLVNHHKLFLWYNLFRIEKLLIYEHAHSFLMCLNRSF